MRILREVCTVYNLQLFLSGMSSLLLKCMNFRIIRYLFLETWQKMRTHVKVYWAHVRVLCSLCAFNSAAVLKRSLHRLQVYAGVCGGFTETLESQSVRLSASPKNWVIFCSATARPGLARIQESMSEYTEYWCHFMCKRQRGYNVILAPALHSSIAAARCDTLQPSQIGLKRDKKHTVLLCKKKGSHSHLRLPIQKQFSLHSSKRLTCWMAFYVLMCR